MSRRNKVAWSSQPITKIIGAVIRMESSGFTIAEATTIPELEKLALSEELSLRMVSMTDALKDMPAYIADKGLSQKILQGGMLTKKDVDSKEIFNKGGFIKIVDAGNDLIAVLAYSKGSSKYSYCCVFNN